MFNSDFIQPVTAIYPDFTYDHAYDVNYGFRYATFAYMWPSYATPTALQRITITLNTPSAVSTITGTRADNNFFPDSPVSPSIVGAAKCRMHVKLLGVHNPATYEPFETGWINAFKECENDSFDDGVYDIGGAVSVTSNTSNVSYKAQINRRFYTNILALVRVGISQDGSIYGGEPLTFTGLTINLTDE